MPHRRQNNALLRWGFVCLACAGFGGVTALAQGDNTDDWTQHLRVGAPVLFNVKSSFNVNGTFNLANQAGATGVSGLNHVYNDGYVKVDGTGDALGQTGFWGYQSGSQYNSVAQTLTMHSTTSYTTSGGSSQNAQPFVGFDAAYGTDLWRISPKVRLGWEVGISLVPIHISDDQPLSATVNQSVFTFNTGAILVPTAPYNGGPSGVGEPTISDIATAHPGLAGPGTVTGSRHLESILYSIRLGPTIYWDFAPHFALLAGAGPAFGILNGDYKFDETITTAGGGSARNSGSFNSTKTTFGGYVNANLVWHAVPHGDIFVGGQYMPMGTMDFAGSGREVHLDLRQTVSAIVGLNWTF